MESIFFQTDDGVRLEGVVHITENAPAVVISHPHPLYGGNMRNDVVTAIESAFQEKGYATLRFNFRGVGNSGGKFSDGKGEQQDVLAAIRYLKAIGAKSIELAGYSFGTWVNAHIAADAPVDRMVMVSPPVTLLDFSELSELPCLTAVITGSSDEIAPPDRIRELLTRWNPRAALEVIEGGDHFYGTTLGDLKAAAKKHLLFSSV